MLISAERTVFSLKKRSVSILALFFTVLMLVSAQALQAEQARLSQKLIRLHVVAASDSAHDQAVKLSVRDAVLARADALMAGAQDAHAALLDGLDSLAQAAQTRLGELGEEKTVTVRLGKERFPTREYDTFALPAGVYESLRVTIGEGEGHNWWCVVFPSICLTASMDELELTAQAAGLTQGELRLITGEEPGFTLKFRTLELLERLKALLTGG